MKKIIMILAIVIVLLSNVYANDNSTININGTVFNIPPTYQNGDNINSGYRLDNIFSIYCINDDIPSQHGFWASSCDYKENISIGNHDVEYYYEYNQYVHNNISHAVFCVNDLFYMITWVGNNITPEIEDMIKNTPKSNIDSETFHNILDDSIASYKENNIKKLNDESMYSNINSQINDKSGINSKYLIYYYNNH